LGINQLQINLGEPAVVAAADVMLESAKGINYGPVTVAGMGMNYTIMFAQPINKADRVMLTISIPDTPTFMGRLNVLPGDVNGDGVVNTADISAIRNEWHGKKAATIYGDIIGNGAVKGSDYSSGRKFLGTKLPKMPGKGMKALVVSDRERGHVRVKTQ
jgi:Dockerin type I domain